MHFAYSIHINSCRYLSHLICIEFGLHANLILVNIGAFSLIQISDVHLAIQHTEYSMQYTLRIYIISTMYNIQCTYCKSMKYKHFVLCVMCINLENNSKAKQMHIRIEFHINLSKCFCYENGVHCLVSTSNAYFVYTVCGL